MSNANDQNTQVGRNFQEKVQAWFEKERKEIFELEHPINIGNPGHPHKFDIVNEMGTTVIECKCYTWTDAGNIPSAKLRGLNEAVFYFSFLPTETEKILVMAYAVHPKKSESLAEYYVRTNKHLLGDVKIWEFDITAEKMRFVEIQNKTSGKISSCERINTTVAQIRQYIMNKKLAAQTEGKTSIVIVARNIHKELNLHNSYPSVCSAMRQCMRDRDVIIHTTKSGFSSTFEVEYRVLECV